jgi:hypothetical protein
MSKQPENGTQALDMLTPIGGVPAIHDAVLRTQKRIANEQAANIPKSSKPTYTRG